MGKNKLDSIMKTMVKSSNINTTKRLTNHSGRKTLVKTLRKSFSKEDTIQITGHSSTRELDAYDSGDDAELQTLYFAIDRASSSASHTTSSSREAARVTHTITSPSTAPTPPWVKSSDDVAKIRKTFNFFSHDEQYNTLSAPPPPVMNFYNCNVTIGGDTKKEQKTTKTKRLRIMSSPSSEEEC